MKRSLNCNIEGAIYHKDRPEDCRLCYYWVNQIEGCVLGPENCYYLVHEVRTEKEEGCAVCPYRHGEVCVSACCYQELVHWMFRRRRKRQLATGKAGETNE